MAMPCSSHASMLSSSRMEPPGWMMAVTPKLASASTLSRNGKNASDAATRFFGSRPMRSHASSARSPAKRPESTRFGWPGPMPMPAWFLEMRMALDFTPLHTFHANSSSSISSSVGLRLVGTVNSSGVSVTASAVWAKMPPSTERYSTRTGASTPPVRRTRRFFFTCKSSSAAGSKLGAIMTSTNCLFAFICSIISSETSTFAAIMPPKALFGSHANALS